MKLSKELYNAGILGRQNTGPTEWVFEKRGTRPTFPNPMGEVIERSMQSIKVSRMGLRVLSNVLRFH